MGNLCTCCKKNDQTDKTIPDDVLNALQEAFKDDADSCARVIYFLTKELSTDPAKPSIRSLQRVLSDAMLFKKVAERMIEDTKTADENPQYHEVLNNELIGMITDNPDGGKGLELAIRENGDLTVAQYNFMRAVSRLTPESFRGLTLTVSAMGEQIAVYGERALTFAREAQPVVREALVAVCLAFNVIENIKRWWKGEITGVRCVKNIVDFGVGIAAGIGGGIGGEMIGAAIGSVFGPVGAGLGAVFGALAGGFVAAAAAESLSDKLTLWVFGLSRSEALEHSYNFLGSKPNDPESVINSRYRRLARKYHPDKGGDADKWTQLQYSLAIIREARGVA